MSASQFIIMAAVVIVGIIFIVAAQKFIFSSSEETEEYKYKAEGENIVSVLDRITKETAGYVSFIYYMDLCNISVKGGVLTYERNGIESSFHVSKEVKDVVLNDISSLCVMKSGNTITLNEECTCNFDSMCAPDECKEACPDCIGPNNVCIGDDFCNNNILENCENSIDCECDSGKCCPDSPDADRKGCSLIEALEKGEECWCDSQCDSELKCSYTTKNFKQYDKACCEEGKSWNGTDCIVPECGYPCEPGCIIPDSFDWRNYQGKNWLNPVRNQAQCGSCWAFSTVGAVEGTYNVEQNLPAANRDLSEQDLVSCDPASGGCQGYWPHLSIAYVKSSGICDENCFPYQDQNTGLSRKTNVPCSTKCSSASSNLWKITSFGAVSGDQNIKRALICDGPLSVTSMNWMHAITLVAYNDNQGVWTIRNSWGTGWGSGGYGNIPYKGHQYSDINGYVYYVDGVTFP